jgi:hypothetical protein
MLWDNCFQIQEVRVQIKHDDKGIQKLNYGVSPIFSASGKQEWFIVLDSNVLLSNIKYMEELRDTNVKGKLQETVATV